ncbi:MAG TPA: sugar phosphate nucleotidyltransferase, partial [Nitrospiria bacterium]|nr:sugar phosphate nucleotidyltransferase [Nitrospiria bacterium]
DHFVREESLFMGCVDLACRAVEQEADRFVLLGMEPYRPESGYGYILPGHRTPNGTFSSLKRVVGFIEKPPRPLVEDLIHRGALWNTFVMVSRVRRLVDLTHRLAPKLFHPFERIRRAIDTNREQDIIDEVYRTLAPVNFSKEVLERLPWDDPLRPFVLPMRGVFWSDPGSERRLMEDLHSAADVNRIKQVVNG